MLSAWGLNWIFNWANCESHKYAELAVEYRCNLNCNISYNILDLVNLSCLRFQKCLSQKLIRWSLNFTLQLVVSLFSTHFSSWPWPCLWLYIVATPRWELVGCRSYKAYLLVLADTNHSPGTAASSHNIRLRNACLSIVKSILHSYNKEDDKLEPWYVCCYLLFISWGQFMSYLFSIMISFFVAI